MVVIAGDIDDTRPGLRLEQNFFDNPRMRVVPVPASGRLNAVQNIAYKVESPAVVMREKIGQVLGLAAARAEMTVGDEDRPVQPRPIG